MSELFSIIRQITNEALGATPTGKIPLSQTNFSIFGEDLICPPATTLAKAVPLTLESRSSQELGLSSTKFLAKTILLCLNAMCSDCIPVLRMANKSAYPVNTITE